MHQGRDRDDLSLGAPILVVAQEEAFTVRVQCRVQEQPCQFEVPHLLKASVCSHYVPRHNGKPAARYFLT